MASRPPIRTGKALKRRGRLEELTGSLGREVEAPVEEIGAAALRRRAVLRWCCAGG
jgi:hypothetical protein